MKFSAMPYSRPDLEAMKANLTACTEAFLAAESAQEQIAQYDRVTDLSVEFNTMGSLANARHTIDTRDEFYDAESTFFDESWPQLSVYFQRLNEAMLDSKFRPELEAHYGSLLFLKLEISRRSFKPELVELMQEENRLTSRYQKLYANMTVEFDGKTMPMPMLGKYKVSADRAVRRAAYEAEGKVFDANRAELDEIYDKLVHNRNAQGRMLGYPNFIQLGYDRLGRNCYGQKELAAFRDQIANDLVPVIAEVKEAQRKRIGVDRLHIYDDKFRFPDGNPARRARRRRSSPQAAECMRSSARRRRNSSTSSTTTSCSTCSPARARPPAATVRCLKNTRLRLSSRTLTAQPETSMC